MNSKYENSFNDYLVKMYEDQVPKEKRRNYDELGRHSVEMSLKELIELYGYDIIIEPETEWSYEDWFSILVVKSNKIEELHKSKYDKISYIKKNILSKEQLSKMRLEYELKQLKKEQEKLNKEMERAQKGLNELK